MLHVPPENCPTPFQYLFILFNVIDLLKLPEVSFPLESSFSRWLVNPIPFIWLTMLLLLGYMNGILLDSHSSDCCCFSSLDSTKRIMWSPFINNDSYSITPDRVFHVSSQG